MKLFSSRLAYGALIAGALSLSACGGDDDGGNGTPDAAPNNTTFTGTYHHYVTNSVKFGASVSEANSFGFDLDGKSPTSDNLIGRTIATFAGQFDIDTAIAEALTEGEFIILHSVRADALAADPSVSWQVYLGDPKPSPDFTGNGTFTVAADSPTAAKLSGAIAGGSYTAQPGTLTLEISITPDGEPLRVELHAARIQATITDTTCSGKIGGAIKHADLDQSIIPFLADQFDARIMADEGCHGAPNTNNCDETSKILLTVFDINPKNQIITAAEVKESAAVSVLSPDVDLLPEQGPSNAAESVSIGLGFTCVKATFTASGEQ